MLVWTYWEIRKYSARNSSTGLRFASACGTRSFKRNATHPINARATQRVSSNSGKRLFVRAVMQITQRDPLFQIQQVHGQRQQVRLAEGAYSNLLFAG